MDKSHTVTYNILINYVMVLRFMEITEYPINLCFLEADGYKFEKVTQFKYLGTSITYDRLCGLVVSVADYKHRGPGLDSRALLRIFLRELGLERGPLSLVIG
jgi:hypothetical protein